MYFYAVLQSLTFSRAAGFVPESSNEKSPEITSILGLLHFCVSLFSREYSLFGFHEFIDTDSGEDIACDHTSECDP